MIEYEICDLRFANCDLNRFFLQRVCLFEVFFVSNRVSVFSGDFDLIFVDVARKSS